MRISNFELYRDLLHRHTGLVLPAEKSYLLDSRLTPVARRWGYPTLEGMTLALRGVPDNGLVTSIVEAMIHDETSFFDAIECFYAIADTLTPSLMQGRGRRNRKLRFWSAGCSTGQEPYSLAMLIKGMEVKLKGWNVEILGTDLSTSALRRAETGDYTQFEVQRGLPVRYLVRYFDEVGDLWRLHDDIRNLVRFAPFNLLDPMDDLGLFDVILCRNVLPSFAPQARASVLSHMAEHLAGDGFLLLGEHERLDGMESLFKPMTHICPGLFAPV